MIKVQRINRVVNDVVVFFEGDYLVKVDFIWNLSYA
jgi:hypothetical protein